MAQAWIVIRYRRFTFAAAKLDEKVFQVRRTNFHGGQQRINTFFLDNEQGGHHWLGDMGLSGRLARRLLDAAIRNEGPHADPKHPLRVT